MGNQILSKSQRDRLFAPLFENVKYELARFSSDDPELLFALRRKLVKELGYLEKGSPTQRKKLQTKIWPKQGGLCAICSKEMPEKGSELDRFEAINDYDENNVQLVHRKCHVADQESNGYS